MKNLISKNYYLLSFGVLMLLHLFYPHTIQAQLLPKKIQVQLGYASSNLQTTEYYFDRGFVFPSYFHQLGKLNGFSVKAHYNVFQFLALGLETGFQHKSLNQENFYLNSRFSFYQLSPYFQLQTPEASKGLFNQLGIFAGGSVVTGILSVNDGLLINLGQQRWTGNPFRHRSLYPQKIQNSFTGYKFHYGARFNVNNNWGVFITHSIFHNYVISAYFPDKEFKGTEITAGIYLRFMSVKRYYQ